MLKGKISAKEVLIIVIFGILVSVVVFVAFNDTNLLSLFGSPSPIDYYTVDMNCTFVTMGNFQAAACEDGSLWNIQLMEVVNRNDPQQGGGRAPVGDNVQPEPSAPESSSPKE